MKTKIVGVTHNNRDGTSRQQILYDMKKSSWYEKGDTLNLIHEKDNPVDPNAVMVLNDKKQCIGYLNTEIAEPISQALDDGYKIYAELLNITGGTDSRPTLGCNIEIPMIDWNYDDHENDNGKKYVVTRVSSGCCIPAVCLIVFFIFIVVFI